MTAVEKLGVRDFFNEVLRQIENLDDDRREKLLATAEPSRARVEVLRAVIQEAARHA